MLFIFSQQNFTNNKKLNDMIHIHFNCKTKSNRPFISLENNKLCFLIPDTNDEISFEEEETNAIFEFFKNYFFSEIDKKRIGEKI